MLSDGDIHYMITEYTRSNTVLGKMASAGITVKLGSHGAALAANQEFIQGTADTRLSHCELTGVSIIRGEVSTLDAVDVSSATNAQKAVS